MNSALESIIVHTRKGWLGVHTVAFRAIRAGRHGWIARSLQIAGSLWKVRTLHRRLPSGQLVNCVSFLIILLSISLCSSCAQMEDDYIFGQLGDKSAMKRWEKRHNRDDSLQASNDGSAETPAQRQVREHNQSVEEGRTQGSKRNPLGDNSEAARANPTQRNHYSGPWNQGMMFDVWYKPKGQEGIRRGDRNEILIIFPDGTFGTILMTYDPTDGHERSLGIPFTAWKHTEGELVFDRYSKAELFAKQDGSPDTLIWRGNAWRFVGFIDEVVENRWRQRMIQLGAADTERKAEYLSPESQETSPSPGIFPDAIPLGGSSRAPSDRGGDHTSSPNLTNVGIDCLISTSERHGKAVMSGQGFSILLEAYSPAAHGSVARGCRDLRLVLNSTVNWIRPDKGVTVITDIKPVQNLWFVTDRSASNREGQVLISLYAGDNLIQQLSIPVSQTGDPAHQSSSGNGFQSGSSISSSTGLGRPGGAASSGGGAGSSSTASTGRPAQGGAAVKPQGGSSGPVVGSGGTKAVYPVNYSDLGNCPADKKEQIRQLYASAKQSRDNAALMGNNGVGPGRHEGQSGYQIQIAEAYEKAAQAIKEKCW